MITEESKNRIMAVRIRLKRMGRRNHPFYRIDVFDSRTQRDGGSIETVGTYDPHIEDEKKKVVFERDRVQHWLDHGALPTETVLGFLRKGGFKVDMRSRSAKARARKKAKQKQGSAK